jgi:hypothetical protein
VKKRYGYNEMKKEVMNDMKSNKEYKTMKKLKGIMEKEKSKDT